MKRTERLFALAEHLRGRRSGVTAEQLADRFEVSVRTIYRDLDSLREASLPLHADRGRGGGYALDRSYALPPVNFTAREASLLLVAGNLMVRQRLLPFVGTLKLALDKVRSALPVRSQRDVDRLMVSLQAVGVPSLPVRSEVRRAVEQAWFEDCPMDIVYDGYKGRTSRRVHLRTVVMDRKETLLNCTDLDKGEPRQFKMHLIVEAVVVSQEK